MHRLPFQLARLRGAWLIALCTLAGCGGGDDVAATRVDARAAFTRGQEAFNRKDYAAAAPEFAVGVEQGGLNADKYSIAGVKLAVCYGALGKY
jgi:hypothetical protein